MTGTCDISVPQAHALAALAVEECVVRLVLTGVQNGYARDLKVEIRTLSYGDVLSSTRYILQSGRVLTTDEFEELNGVGSALR